MKVHHLQAYAALRGLVSRITQAALRRSAGAPTIRFRLVLLVMASTAIAVGVAAVLFLEHALEERASAEAQVKRIAHAGAQFVEQEMAVGEAFLTGLSVSPALQSGDLAAFHRQASAAQPFPGSWILLFDRGFERPADILVNTHVPFGTPPRVGKSSATLKEFIGSIVATRKPLVSGLEYAPLINDDVVAVGMPITRGGAVAYVLVLVVRGVSAAPSFAEEDPESEWLTGVIDGAGKFLPARGATHAAADEPRFQLPLSVDAASQDGIVSGTASDGTPLYVAFSRSSKTGWTVFAAAPKRKLDAPIHRAFLIIGGGGVLLLLLGSGIAFVAGPRVTLPLSRRIVEDEERFRIMANTVPSILFTTGPDGDCDYANERFYAYTGMSSGSAEGLGWVEALHPEDRLRISRLLRDRPAASNPTDVEFRLRGRNGLYRWFVGRSTAVMDGTGNIIRYFGTATDIDDLKRTEAALRRLSTRLMKIQDDERRRIARDIHDTTAQNLTAAKMQIEQVRDGAVRTGAAIVASLDEASELLALSLQELRTLSYILHPPMLDQFGLASAVRWYAHGFEKRSGIRVAIEAPEQLPRSSIEIESTLFRVIQEALANIHRHSGSSEARIVLECRAGRIKVEITDRGKGMPNFSLGNAGDDTAYPGVGISGMHLRMQQLGGRLEIDTSEHGTTVRAVVEGIRSFRKAPRVVPLVTRRPRIPPNRIGGFGSTSAPTPRALP